MQKKLAPIPAAALVSKRLEITTADTEATMWLYGFIGEEYEMDYDTWEYKQVGITDFDFVTQLNELAAEYKVIHLRINSLGGSVYHGNAILTAIANCPAEVHTWNDGCAASMAADIWMCGHRRHMAKNAMLMVHPASMGAWGTATVLRAAADLCDKLTEATILACASSLGITPEELRQRYYATGNDIWLNYADVERDGMLTDTADGYDSQTPLPADAQKLTYTQLLKQYTAVQPAAEEEPSWVSKLFKLFTKAQEDDGQRLPHLKNAPAPPPLPAANTQPDNVTLDDLNAALEAGTFSVADVEAALAARKQATTPAPDPALVALTAELNELKATVKTLQAAPGAAQTTPPAPAGDPAPGGEAGSNPLAAAAKEFEDALQAGVKQGYNPFRTGVVNG